jgi:D-erythronate 2-dehydrogenase
MRILIIGAAGMIGRKLLNRLVLDRMIAGQRIDAVQCVDVATPPMPQDIPFAVSGDAADICDPAVARRLVERRPDVIFHLAAVVSGEAEANFDLGYRVNLQATLSLFEAIRAVGGDYRPRVVFTSSLAVYGAPLPDPVPDDHHLTPLTSYGVQKAACELLLADYSRRGVLDGIGLRLPTICVRPGLPNRAASGFFSGIIREPLNGLEAVLPVDDDVKHWFASPRAAVGFLIHAAGLDTGRLGASRSFVLPGVAATVGEQIDALRRAAGEAAVRRIRRVPDPAVARIIAGWPRAFTADQGRSLGFVAESTFDEIIQIHVEDELGGQIAA